MTGLPVTIDASRLGGTVFPGGSTPRIPIPANGQITVPAIDVGSYLAAGARLVRNITRQGSPPVAPRAASAGRIVASAALSNGTLTIANQPDVPRQLAVRVDPGTVALTGGNVALTYTANDGTTQVDNISAATPASTPATTLTSKGVQSLTSAIVTGVAGGASPKVQVNDTNSISMLVDANYTNFTLLSTDADGAADGTVAVASSAASYTPSTAPNGTHTYSASYGYSAS